MIELYSLHWSHYVEKVRWALDYKQLDYRIVPVSVPGKPEMAHLDCAGIESASAGRVLAVPTILDSTTGACVTDSSEIIAYLEKAYPESPALLGRTPAERQEIRRWMLYLDREVGLPARRLAYTQVILEAPDILPELFLARRRGLLKRRFLRWGAAVVLSGMLIQRFRFLQARRDRIVESLFAVLHGTTARIVSHGHIAGGKFSGADIALASLLRPLRIVPVFREAVEFSPLFAWQEEMFLGHGRECEMLYERRIRERRERLGWSMGGIDWLRTGNPDGVAEVAGEAEKARNDQH
ncbi:MAG TPA: glutathione S-transferase family protein, partial [Gammaproteobacteria bacterium]